MSEQKPTETAEGQEVQGLGFSQLSMNEIAPAVTAEPSEEGKRTGSAWLIAVVVLAVFIGGGWALRSALNFPPPSDVQQRFEDQVSALPFSQDGTLQRVKFLTGTSVQVDFAPTISTQDADQRTTLRQASTAVLRLLVKTVPDKDVSVVGLQGETKITEARYSPRSDFGGKGAHTADDIEASIWVRDGEQDSIGSSRDNTARLRGASESGGEVAGQGAPGTGPPPPAPKARAH